MTDRWFDSTERLYDIAVADLIARGVRGFMGRRDPVTNLYVARSIAHALLRANAAALGVHS